MSEKTTLGENGIYDARSLGVPKMLCLLYTSPSPRDA